MPHRIVILLALVVLAAAAGAQKQPARPDIPVEDALRGPERHDIPWDVRILPPRLTFQQRHLVEVRIKVDVSALRNRTPARDLHFLLKVADERGKWFDDESYYHLGAPPALDKKQELQYVAGMYLRPGGYTVAAILYDSSVGYLNVARKAVEVPSPHHDPLPELDRDLPRLEFLPEVPRDRATNPSSAAMPPRVTPPWWPRRVPVSETGFGDDPANDQTWTLGSGREWLPVARTRPLQVDVILNFSRSEDERSPKQSPTAYRQNAGAVLQMGSVLSHLGVTDGCVRVHGVDILRMGEMFDAVDGRTADWDKISEAIYKTDRVTVDVGTLAGRKQASAYFRDYLLRLFSAPGCDAGGAAGDRAVIIVGRDFEFAPGTKVEKVAPESCHCRVYYLDLPAPRTVDQLEPMLQPLKPRRLHVGDSRQFRDALADIVRDLGSKAADRAR